MPRPRRTQRLPARAAPARSARPTPRAVPGSGFAARGRPALVRGVTPEFACWHVDAPGRGPYAGEMGGNWVWLIVWQADAGLLGLERLEPGARRDPGRDRDLPFGGQAPM